MDQIEFEAEIVSFKMNKTQGGYSIVIHIPEFYGERAWELPKWKKRGEGYTGIPTTLQIDKTG